VPPLSLTFLAHPRWGGSFLADVRSSLDPSKVMLSLPPSRPPFQPFLCLLSLLLSLPKSLSIKLTPQTYPNAVIMGRKTWDSIPPRFRPLADRLNVVISRSVPTIQPPKPGTTPELAFASSLEDALAHLQQGFTPRKVFVIGGGQIYGAALALAQTRRILLTRVLTDFECDTFFPLKLSEGETTGWKRSSHTELEAWTGVEVPEGVQEENGTEYEFQMWERVDR